MFISSQRHTKKTLGKLLRVTTEFAQGFHCVPLCTPLRLNQVLGIFAEPKPTFHLFNILCIPPCQYCCIPGMVQSLGFLNK